MYNWQAVAERSWNKAQSKQWLCAMIAARREIATWQSLPNYELSKLRGAWQMYCFIRQYQPAQAHALRKQYEYRRFYELYLLWKEHEFSADECVEHLQFDGGIAGMCGQVLEVHSPYPEWWRKGQQIVKLADVIFTSYDAPQEFRDAVKVIKDYLEKGLEQ